MLQKKGLGFSYVRLLPKERGVRAIVNLKRRAVKVGVCTFLLLHSSSSVLFVRLRLDGGRRQAG